LAWWKVQRSRGQSGPKKRLPGTDRQARPTGLTLREAARRSEWNYSTASSGVGGEADDCVCTKVFLCMPPGAENIAGEAGGVRSENRQCDVIPSSLWRGFTILTANLLA
jgi:hypothetical protein